MSESKIYASFNTLTITGRVYHTEIVQTASIGEFLAVTLMTELMDDGDSICVTFNNTNGLLSLAKKGWLNNGRRVTVTGHLQERSPSSTSTRSSARPSVSRTLVSSLDKAVVFDGGLGPAKKADADLDGDIEIDDTPELPKKKKPVASTPSGSAVIDF